METVLVVPVFALLIELYDGTPLQLVVVVAIISPFRITTTILLSLQGVSKKLFGV